MRSLILSITGSLIIFCSYPEKTGTQNDHFINKAVQRSNQLAESGNTLVSAVPAIWQGKYSAYFSYGDIAGQNAGWALEINITKDKITATGEGFQMAFVDELRAKVSGSKLILTHFKNVSGYNRGKGMNPEFTLINDHGKFYIQSKWIDSDVITKPAALGYKIDRSAL
ncbi:hypothetical protein [Pedobacter metabolipauper]|uniref:Uncharacterized protein n=1 Tax=Pedobacter metabolipauper TaxID=425513 RepID=A0A4R6T209_9SPHI|nr:hypothetical protein [Pedobacter metabolipauper]TDQ11718.1 hypothetical protein ATK78_0845 [Pedobacter metabolipauper]